MSILINCKKMVQSNKFIAMTHSFLRFYLLIYLFERERERASEHVCTIVVGDGGWVGEGQ